MQFIIDHWELHNHRIEAHGSILFGTFNGTDYYTQGISYYWPT